MISVDALADAPPFEQVRAQFAQQISDGTLPAGTRLPTVRALAGDLGIAVNTVARAYRELELAGLVETRGRAGTIVTARGDRAREELQQAAAAFAARTRALGIDPGEALALITAALPAQHADARADGTGSRPGTTQLSEAIVETR